MGPDRGLISHLICRPNLDCICTLYGQLHNFILIYVENNNMNKSKRDVQNFRFS